MRLLLLCSYAFVSSLGQSSSFDYNSVDRISGACAVNIVCGTLSSMAEVEYSTLKNAGFKQCPKLAQAASTLALLSFDFEEQGTLSEITSNLNTLSQVFKELKPAWTGCQPVKEALTKEEYRKVLSVMTVFAEPSKYDLYKVGKYALANWAEV